MTDPRASDPSVPPDWETLARHQAGESSEAEAQRVEAWLATHPEDARLLREMEAAFVEHVDDPAAASLVAEEDVDVEAALAAVKRRRDAGDGQGAKVIPFPQRARQLPEIRPVAPHVPAVQPRRARGVWAGIGVAAAAAALVTVGVLRDRGGARLAQAGESVHTAVGQRDSVRLPDGTRVVLAPGTRLAVAGGYGQGARVVTLDGAALFTVEHDERAPFTVRAGGALVRDLGTVFTVRTDGVASPRGVAVSVLEGVVSLRNGESDSRPEVTLRAGDRGDLSADGVPTAHPGAASADDAAWARGRIVYRAVPIAQVRADLRRWYGIELQVEDGALAARTLTATFEQADPPARVLDVIALALGATVDRFGTTAVLRPGGGPSR